MSETLFTSFLSAPHVIVTIAVALSATASLALTYLKKNYGIVAAKSAVVRLNRRLGKEKLAIENRLEQEMDIRSKREEELLTRISSLEQSLRLLSEKESDRSEEMAQLRRDFSSSVKAVGFNAAVLLAEMKKELLHRVDNIEKIETKLTTVQLSGNWPTLTSDDTPPYGTPVFRKKLPNSTIPAEPEGYEQYLETYYHEDQTVSSLNVDEAVIEGPTRELKVAK